MMSAFGQSKHLANRNYSKDSRDQNFKSTTWKVTLFEASLVRFCAFGLKYANIYPLEEAFYTNFRVSEACLSLRLYLLSQ